MSIKSLLSMKCVITPEQAEARKLMQSDVNEAVEYAKKNTWRLNLPRIDFNNRKVRLLWTLNEGGGKRWSPTISLWNTHIEIGSPFGGTGRWKLIVNWGAYGKSAWLVAPIFSNTFVVRPAKSDESWEGVVYVKDHPTGGS